MDASRHPAARRPEHSGAGGAVDVPAVFQRQPGHVPGGPQRRIVWINDGYKRFLPDLGFSSVDQFVGHMVEDVVPNTQMRRVLETGSPS
jgi:hypothetical protein